MSEVPHETREVFHILIPEVLSENELENLQTQVEKLLIEKQQDVVLSLRNIDTIFSIHLTAFIQLYKLLKSFNLRFVLADISPAVLNVMQMTHLENLLPIFISLEDYEESLGGSVGGSGDGSLDFEFREENDVFFCKGHMAFGSEVKKLFETISDESRFDMAAVGYVESKVLGMIEDRKVSLVNPGNVILEIIKDNGFEGRISVEP